LRIAEHPWPIFPLLHQPWGLTATSRARRFVLILDNISTNKNHVKEAELERAEIENRQSEIEKAFSFSVP